jgi:hypothetical protein
LTKQELIDEVMDNFDFGKVAKTMKALDWVWATTEFYIPEESDIRKHARGLLNKAYDGAISKEDNYTVATGGFEAAYEIDYKVLSLRFIVSSWETDGEF